MGNMAPSWDSAPNSLKKGRLPKSPVEGLKSEMELEHRWENRELICTAHLVDTENGKMKYNYTNEGIMKCK